MFLETRTITVSKRTFAPLLIACSRHPQISQWRAAVCHCERDNYASLTNSFLWCGNHVHIGVANDCTDRWFIRVWCRGWHATRIKSRYTRHDERTQRRDSGRKRDGEEKKKERKRGKNVKRVDDGAVLKEHTIDIAQRADAMFSVYFIFLFLQKTMTTNVWGRLYGR